MSTDLEVQIRNLYDLIQEEQQQVAIEDVKQPLAPVIDAPLASSRREVRHGWIVGIAAAAVVLLLGLLAFLVRQSTSEAPVITQPPPAPTVVEPEPSPTSETEPALTTPEVETAAELVWTASGLVFPESVSGAVSALVSDGNRFFTIIGGEVSVSGDGFVWDIVEINNMPAGAALDWADVDAAVSKILLLSIDGRQASTVLIDIAGGEAFESILPFEPVGPVVDLRGFIAINDEGEAVALLYDLLERGIGETPAFYSADGINWSQIPAGELPDGTALQPAAIGDGFVVTDAFDQPSNTYWHSPDGRTWDTNQADGTLGGSLVAWGDSAISYVESAFGPQAISASPTYLLTAETGSELVVDLPPLEGEGSYGPVIAAGGIGIASFTSRGPEPQTWYLEYSPDGVTWIRQTLPFTNINAFQAQPAANQDRVLVNAGGEIWVGVHP